MTSDRSQLRNKRWSVLDTQSFPRQHGLMERRRASFLFCDQQEYTFLESESFDQYSFSRDVANLAELDLKDGCEVFLAFDRSENLVEVVLAEPERVLHDLYEAITREKFAPEYIKAFDLKPIAGSKALSHRAIYLYRRDPVALVVDGAHSGKRVPLADLVREFPFPAFWRALFEPASQPYHGPYGEQAEEAYRALTA